MTANPSSDPQVQIAVVGLGYVGCVTAACLAEMGHLVVGVDRDSYKVEQVTAGKAPFFEPGLDEAVAAGVAVGLLRATTSMEEALRTSDVVLICVGTPSEKNGNLSLTQLHRVCQEISGLLESRTKPLIIAVRSTVFPGTCEDLHDRYFRASGKVSVVANPEFLREGVAMQDYREPSLLVVGGTHEDAVRRVAALYSSLPVEASLVSLRTAEMIKYACNAFHAVKVAFANEIGALAGTLGVDGGEVMQTLCNDRKLNASAAYLKPGFAFGGSCLPKDLRALVYRATKLDLRLPLLSSALPSNQEHLDRAINAVLDLGARRIGIIGIAFKENTDDIRESPVISLLERLIGKGCDLRAYDPSLTLDSIYGTNLNFLLNAIPHIGRLLVPLPDVLGWADHLVVTQKLTPVLSQAVRESGLPVLDVARPAALVASAPQVG
jgi:GDP-mannose 6-dehydrogenase